jgi:hypothetical protein
MALAGALFGAAFLIRQPALLAVPSVAVWLAINGKASLRRLTLLSLGAVVPIVVALIGFALEGSFSWFWNANVSYFFYYVPTGNRITDALLPLLFLPLFVTLAVLLAGRMREQVAPSWALPALWLSAAFIGSLLNGKDYSHYLLLTFPPLTLLGAALWPASIRLRLQRGSWPALAVIAVTAISWFTVVGNVYGDPLGRHWTKGLNYYGNFFDLVTHRESRQQYDAFFDKRTRTTSALEEFFVKRGAGRRTAFIWGEYPWVYALADLTPVSRYVTSYYMLEDDERGPELMSELQRNPPSFIVIASDAEPRPDRSPTRERYNRMVTSLQNFVASRYQRVAQAGNATIFALSTAPVAAGSASR